ncbi:MAG TPA: protein translocase subunit SecF [Candidatus Eremiobacteraeota bacterium]|nr:MAG: preprotein translocase subunit SecF [bacterium ADurb.Bin363]HPZ08423.1 protein translocase subunit SecF [Candidatus Eremiobacteraeota bacterium]
MSFFNFRDKEWDIIGKRKYVLAFSAILIIISIVSLATKGINFGLDFSGGTKCEIRFAKPVTSEQVRDAFTGLVFKSDSGDIDMTHSLVQQSQTDMRVIIIRAKYLEETQIQEVYRTLESKIGHFERLGTAGIGATVGKQVSTNAGIALLIVLVLQLIYITIRFSNNLLYGIAVDIALLHDVMVMVGLYSLLGLEVDSPFLAALLTVVGYSVMDTIVIFDRVRENKLLLKTMTFEKLINKSILQTMTRSIYTLLTVEICLFALLIFGGETLKIFAIALIIGVTAGTYSSIFIACPFVVICEKWLSDKQSQKREERLAQLASAKKKVKKQSKSQSKKEKSDSAVTTLSENNSSE